MSKRKYTRHNKNAPLVDGINSLLDLAEQFAAKFSPFDWRYFEERKTIEAAFDLRKSLTQFVDQLQIEKGYHMSPSLPTATTPIVEPAMMVSAHEAPEERR